MKKKVIWIIVILAVIFLIAFFGLRGKKTTGIQVKVKEAQSGDIQSLLSTTGTVKSKVRDEYVSLNYKISKINAAVGDSVKSGDVLAVYDTSDLSLQVKTLKLQYENAVLSRNDLYNQNKQIDDQIKSIDNQISDKKNKLKSASDLDMIKKLNTDIEGLESSKSTMVKISSEKLKQADNSVQLSKLSLDSVKNKLNEADKGIRAKHSGTVTEVNIKEDSMANSMSPAIVVQDIKSLYVLLSVSKYDANNIKIEQDAEAKLRDKSYKGKVTKIDPSATTSVSASGQTTNLGVNVDILDAAADLKLDFDVDVDILLGSAKNVIKIPAESIVTDKDGLNSVFIYDNGKAVKREVTLGIQSDTESQVTKGIKEKEKVILNPTDSIEDGTAVVISNGDAE